MPVTASYSAVLKKLSVLGDALGNSIVFTRDGAGTLFVNGGAVAITNGPATTANTDLIEAFGLDENDVITLDETGGLLPAASLSGGNGGDTLTGGSNNDTLNGDAGADFLFGGAGIDQLFGGTENDQLTGGTGNDTVDGGAGGDTFFWAAGDGSDVLEGGADTDILQVNGTDSVETFLVSQNGTRVSLAYGGVAPATLDIGTMESLVVYAGGGNDAVATSGALSGLIALTIDGGAGNDTIHGGNGADVLIGGSGNDAIDGNSGNDTAFLGSGIDSFTWDPGDGNDVIEGQGDTDALLFNGSNASETINIAPNGGRIAFQRDVAAILLDLNDLEIIRYNALGGLDNVVVGDLTGTDATGITLDFAGTLGGLAGDGFVDSATLNGTNAADVITASSGATVSVTGLPAPVTIEHQDAADRLILNGQGGDDTISASGVAAGSMFVEMNGGLGADTFLGSGGNDLMTGGDGNDVALMGGGNDVFVWNPGDDNDTLEGQTGIDTLDFNGSAAIENITISANGGRILFFRDVAAVTMDLNDVEQIVFDALGGADVITINNLAGTDGTLVTVNLAGTLGGTTGDSAIDTITASGSGGIDAITIAGSAGAYTATGLPYTLAVNQSEAGDALLINAGAGADTASATGLSDGTATLTLIGGTGNDNLTGSTGADILQGGNDQDTLIGGPGADQLLGELGNDTMVWNPGDGSDVFEGGDGADIAQVNGGGGSESFTITANAARVRFDRIDPAPFTLDIGTTESLVLNAGGGNDTISTSGNLAALISLTIDAGAGDDTVLGSNGADVILGGDGNDFVDGQQGNDVAFLGAGNDTFQWDPGDGNDIVEGQAGTDALLFNGSGANEIFDLSANGGRTLLTRNVGAIVMDMDDLEAFTINALGGTDLVVIDPLAGTDAAAITINLSGTIGGTTGDAAIDTTTLTATSGNDTITATGVAGALSIAGLATAVAINHGEASDILEILGGSGNDTISAAAIQASEGAVRLDGGDGNDTLISGGDGQYFGGANDDLMIAGLTSSSETMDGGTGIDTLDTRSFSGTYTVNMVTGATNFAGESFLNFENVITGNGADTVTGTAGANIIATGAGIDNVNGGAGNDIIAGGAGGDTLDGGTDFDTLDYRTSSAGITVSLASGTATGGDAAGDVFSNFEGVIGSAHNDVIFGNAAGNDLHGGRGSDALRGNVGNDAINGGFGLDTAQFSGPRSSHALTLIGQVTFIQGPEGADTLVSIERMQFSDGIYEYIATGFTDPALITGTFGAGASAGGWSSNRTFPRTLADVDGNGRPDIVGFGSAGVYVALTDANGVSQPATLALNQFGADPAAGGWSDNRVFPRTLADINGDGKADLIGFGAAGVYAALATSGGAFGAVYLAEPAFGADPPAGGWSDNRLYPRMLGDVNGDGMADIVGFGDGGVFVSLATGAGQFADAILATGEFGAGLASGGWADDDVYTRMLADVNDDGRADIVGFGSAGVYTAFAREDGTFNTAIFGFAGFGADPAAGGWSSNELYYRTAGDIDGDGRADLVGFGDGGVHVAYGDGAGGFSGGTVILAGFGAGASAGGWTSQNLYPRLIADFDNDGAGDIIGFGDGGVIAATSVTDWVLV